MGAADQVVWLRLAKLFADLQSFRRRLRFFLVPTSIEFINALRRHETRSGLETKTQFVLRLETIISTKTK